MFADYGLIKIELFHDNFIPLYVISISFIIPCQFIPALATYIYPVNRYLHKNNESLSSSFLQLANAVPKVP